MYDKTLKSYEAASVKIATSLTYLNSGQNVIFSSALTVMMGLAAQGIIKGQSSLSPFRAWAEAAADSILVDRHDILQGR